MPAEEKEIIFFPHFHYDVVWKFNKEDYWFINLRLLRQAVALCSLFPDFRLGIENAYSSRRRNVRTPSSSRG